MNNTRDIDVLAVGSAVMDLVLTVPGLPSHDEKVVGEMVGWLPGGPSANCACAASRLGLRVSSFAVLGDDQEGRRIKEGLEAFGVDTSHIQILPRKNSPFTVVFVDPTGEKVIIIVPSRYAFPLDVAAEIFPRTQVFYMFPSQRDQFLLLAPIARSCGTQVMIDVEPNMCDQRDQLEAVLALTDIASFNQFGFRSATGQEPSVEAARNLLELGPHTIIITRGREGSLAVTRDEAVEQAGHEVTVVDTTGAGDTFHGAYLTALLRGDPLIERLRFANATAAISVTAMGARGRLPTQEEVAAFLAERERRR